LPIWQVINNARQKALKIIKESRLSTCGKRLAFLNCYRMAATQAGCKFHFTGLGARHSKEKAIKEKIFIRIPVYQ